MTNRLPGEHGLDIGISDSDDDTSTPHCIYASPFPTLRENRKKTSLARMVPSPTLVQNQDFPENQQQVSTLPWLSKKNTPQIS